MDRNRTAGTLAFTFYWAWLFSALVGSSLLGNVSVPFGIVVRLSGAVGLSIGLIVQYLLMPRISFLNSRIFVAVCILFPLAYSFVLLFPGLFDPSSWILPASMFLAGISVSLILNGIGAGFSSYPRKYATMSTCIASAAGALIAALVSLVGNEFAIICVGFFIPASTILFRIAKLVPEPETREDRRRAFSVVRRYRTTLFFMLMYSMLFGLVLVSGSMVEPSGQESTYLLLAITAPGILVLFLLVGTRIRVDVESLRRVFLALSIVGIIPSLFTGGGITFASLLLLTISFGMFDIANFVTVYEIIRENELPQLSSFALGRVLSELGIVIGWTAGILSFRLADDGGRLVVYIAIAIVVVIVIGLALLGHGGSDYEKLQEDKPEAFPPDPYQNRTRVLALIGDEFSLSPREREILEMLVAGRSPKRVSEKLFISESTAKSHCYHIYQKMGIHSQQDLIDLFEERLGSYNQSQWKQMP